MAEVELDWTDGESLLGDYEGTEETPSTESATPVSPEATPEVAIPSEPDIDISAALSESLGETKPEQEEPSLPEEPNERVKALKELFAKELGVDVSTAIDNMNQFNQASEAVLSQIQEAETRLALKMQELSVKEAWAGESPGVDVDALYQDRIRQCTAAYAKLPEAQQQQLASMGAKGVLTLWNVLQKTSAETAVGSVVPRGTQANIANNSEAIDLEDLVALNDADFDRQMRLIAQKRMRVIDNG